jgi:predicted translin family RNA/ssDNA-binding protein
MNFRLRWNPLVFTTRDAIDAQIEEAKERAQRAEAKVSELLHRNIEVSKVNLELTREIVRLSKRQVPVVEEGDIADPPTTAEADRVAARRAEQSQAPAPGPKRPSED